MINFEIMIWSLIATIIRILRDVINHKAINIVRAFFTMLAGVSCSYLFTSHAVEVLKLSPDKTPVVSFVLGLLGKEVVEILLNLNLTEVFKTILNLPKADNNVLEENETKQLKNGINIRKKRIKH